MKFQAVIKQSGKTATGIEVPEEAVAALGSRRAPVVATIGGYTYRTTLGSMGGVCMIPLSAEHRGKAGVAAGDEVEVGLEPDSEPREAIVPEDLTDALAGHPDARQYFEKLSYSHKRAYIEWIEQAKKAETRQSRVIKALAMLQEGRTYY